jgi:L-galactono-1,4-lactone dehydrogenase
MEVREGGLKWLWVQLVTPGQGTLELSEGTNPALFRLARCGLGALGVVAEVTLQCVPAHRLLESTWVSNMAEIKKNHAK